MVKDLGFIILIGGLLSGRVQQGKTCVWEDLTEELIPGKRRPFKQEALLDCAVVDRAYSRLAWERRNRQKLELALKASEAQLKTILDSAIVSIVGLKVFADRTWKYEYHSIGCEAVFGYSSEDFAANPSLWQSRVNAEDLKTIFPKVWPAIFAKRPIEVEYRFYDKKGSIRWIASRYASRRSETEDCWLVTVVDTDISDRIQAEATLRDSEVRFRQIFTNAPLGMVVVSPEGQIAQVNQTFCQLLGYCETELKRLPLKNITHPEDFQQELPLLAQLLKGELSNYKLETRYLKRNGEIVWTSLTCSLLRDPDSAKLYKLVAIEKMTDKRVVERMKDSFVSVVSHELRTPLSSISGALGLLATRQLGTLCPEGEELLTIAIAESQRLVGLVSDILDWERIEAGHLTLKREACQVKDLIGWAYEGVRSLAEIAEIQIEISSVSATIWVDGDRILQTLTHLLDNAIKFSPAKTTIQVTAELVFSAVLISIQDRGRGIPPARLESIFEAFEQVDASDSRQKGGTGLGLAICRSIVQQHGGQIWAKSTLGEGSHFFFTLPLHPLAFSDSFDS